METPYLLEADDRSDWVRDSRVPDVSFISHTRFLEARARQQKPNDPIRSAPDLAIEIISPGDSYQDIDDKITDYLRYDVKLIWLINPKQRTVRVITSDNPVALILSDLDSLTGSSLLEGWSMRVADFFDTALE